MGQKFIIMGVECDLDVWRRATTPEKIDQELARIVKKRARNNQLLRDDLIKLALYTIKENGFSVNLPLRRAFMSRFISDAMLQDRIDSRLPVTQAGNVVAWTVKNEALKKALGPQPQLFPDHDLPCKSGGTLSDVCLIGLVTRDPTTGEKVSMALPGGRAIAESYHVECISSEESYPEVKKDHTYVLSINYGLQPAAPGRYELQYFRTAQSEPETVDINRILGLARTLASYADKNQLTTLQTTVTEIIGSEHHCKLRWQPEHEEISLTSDEAWLASGYSDRAIYSLPRGNGAEMHHHIVRRLRTSDTRFRAIGDSASLKVGNTLAALARESELPEAVRGLGDWLSMHSNPDATQHLIQVEGEFFWSKPSDAMLTYAEHTLGVDAATMAAARKYAGTLPGRGVDLHLIGGLNQVESFDVEIPSSAVSEMLTFMGDNCTTDLIKGRLQSVELFSLLQAMVYFDHPYVNELPSILGLSCRELDQFSLIYLAVERSLDKRLRLMLIDNTAWPSAIMHAIQTTERSVDDIATEVIEKLYSAWCLAWFQHAASSPYAYERGIGLKGEEQARIAKLAYEKFSGQRTAICQKIQWARENPHENRLGGLFADDSHALRVTEPEQSVSADAYGVESTVMRMSAPDDSTSREGGAFRIGDDDRPAGPMPVESLTQARLTYRQALDYRRLLTASVRVDEYGTTSYDPASAAYMVETLRNEESPIFKKRVGANAVAWALIESGSEAVPDVTVTEPTIAELMKVGRSFLEKHKANYTWPTRTADHKTSSNNFKDVHFALGLRQLAAEQTSCLADSRQKGFYRANVCNTGGGQPKYISKVDFEAAVQDAGRTLSSRFERLIAYDNVIVRARINDGQRCLSALWLDPDNEQHEAAIALHATARLMPAKAWSAGKLCGKEDHELRPLLVDLDPHGFGASVLAKGVTETSPDRIAKQCFSPDFVDEIALACREYSDVEELPDAIVSLHKQRGQATKDKGLPVVSDGFVVFTNTNFTKAIRKETLMTLALASDRDVRDFTDTKHQIRYSSTLVMDTPMPYMPLLVPLFMDRNEWLADLALVAHTRYAWGARQGQSAFKEIITGLTQEMITGLIQSLSASETVVEFPRTFTAKYGLSSPHAMFDQFTRTGVINFAEAARYITGGMAKIAKQFEVELGDTAAGQLVQIDEAIQRCLQTHKIHIQLALAKAWALENLGALENAPAYSTHRRSVQQADSVEELLVRLQGFSYLPGIFAEKIIPGLLLFAPIANILERINVSPSDAFASVEQRQRIVTKICQADNRVMLSENLMQILGELSFTSPLFVYVVQQALIYRLDSATHETEISLINQQSNFIDLLDMLEGQTSGLDSHLRTYLVTQLQQVLLSDGDSFDTFFLRQAKTEVTGIIERAESQTPWTLQKKAALLEAIVAADSLDALYNLLIDVKVYGTKAPLAKDKPRLNQAMEAAAEYLRTHYNRKLDTATLEQRPTSAATQCVLM